MGTTTVLLSPHVDSHYLFNNKLSILITYIADHSKLPTSQVYKEYTFYETPEKVKNKIPSFTKNLLKTTKHKYASCL